MAYSSSAFSWPHSLDRELEDPRKLSIELPNTTPSFRKVASESRWIGCLTALRWRACHCGFYSATIPVPEHY